jgi:hypothetical protein
MLHFIILKTNHQPVYLNIRLWAQPSTDAVSPAKAHGSLLPALGAHARLRALAARAASHFLCARLWCIDGPVSLTWFRPCPLCCPRGFQSCRASPVL